MSLRYAPGDLDQCKSQIRMIPGYPIGEELPIRGMVFESGALWRIRHLLLRAGIKQDQAISVVMVRALMKRDGNDLKALIRHRFTLGELFVFLNWDQETLWTLVNKSP